MEPTPSSPTSPVSRAWGVRDLLVVMLPKPLWLDLCVWQVLH